MSYEFADMKFIPMAGEKITINLLEGKTDILTIVSREFHISPNGQQSVSMKATKE